MSDYPLYSLKHFTYDPVERTLTIEASTLGWAPDRWDVELWISSHVTGRVIRFIETSAMSGVYPDSKPYDGVVYRPYPAAASPIAYVVVIND